ncbi:TIGR04211 family SH3 domain-containing protein [Beggiatoa alba]|nr:TIGR04211 family SH3 domain-containing protein [Beggiatoa alba]
MRFLSAIFYLVLFIQSASVMAKSVFVNDQLRVGVRPEPTQIVAPIGVVLTGMKLEVLKRKDIFIKIRAENGLEGWIKDIYVTEKIPAILRLKDLDRKHKKSQQQLLGVEKTKTALEEDNSILKDKINVLKAERAELQRNQIIQTVSSTRLDKGLPVLWLIISLIIGFIGGFFWHRYQSMKRLGGLRI